MSLINVVFFAIFVVQINCFNYQHHSKSSFLLSNNRHQLLRLSSSQSSISTSSLLQIPLEIESIKNEVERYMDIRKSTNATMLPPESIEVAPTSGVVKKPENPFAFIQPSGRNLSVHVVFLTYFRNTNTCTAIYLC